MESWKMVHRHNKILTFCPVNIGITEKERSILKEEISSVNDDYWFYDDFRECKQLPFFNAGGEMRKFKSKNREFKFTEAGKKCKLSMEICKNKVLNWMHPQARITILKTTSNFGLKEHIDCTKKEIGTPQYKFRVVLSGKVNKLFFLNEEGEKEFIPDNYKEYILDGGHPHGFDPHRDMKLTLCAGAPWGKKNLPNNILLDKSKIVSRPKTLKKEWYKE